MGSRGIRGVLLAFWLIVTLPVRLPIAWIRRSRTEKIAARIPDESAEEGDEEEP